MAKVAINISNCTSGGGFQISVWFVRKLMERGFSRPVDASYIVNASQLAQLPAEISSVNLLVVDASPMRSSRSRNKIAKFLKELSPDVVFSTFGPSGIKFERQIVGIANAFVTSRNLRTFINIYGLKGIYYYAVNFYFGVLISRSKYLMFETGSEKRSFSRLFKFPDDRAFVIPNSVNDVFLINQALLADSAIGLNEKIDILVVTSSHRHKNAHMIPEYIREMRNSGFRKFRFLVTLSKADFHKITGGTFDDVHVSFLGNLTPPELLAAYSSCDLVVNPSALETYSAVFNEVRFAAKPLMVSDRAFARDICGSFATFFEPDDPSHFVTMLKELISKLPEASKASWDARKDVLLPDQKFDKMLAVIEQAIQR